MNAPAPHLAQAAALMSAARFEDAIRLLMTHMRGKAHPHTPFMLSISHEALGNLDQAVYFAERAAAAGPGDAMLAAGLSQRLFVAGKTEAALDVLERFASRSMDAAVASSRIALLGKLNRDDEALALHASLPAPVARDSSVVDAVATVLLKMGRIDEARAMTDRAGRPLGASHALQAAGRVADASAALREACERFPASEGAWTLYASSLNYVETATLEEMLRAHTGYAAAVRARVGPAQRQWPNSAEPERPLRIGIVSPDLRRHAIVSFLAPLLERQDRSQWHVTAYSTHYQQDDVSARLKTLVDAWRWLPTAYPGLLTRRVREDRIDVLIELSGHTEQHKLDEVHLRAAPVQATYLGYPNTTGLDTVDVRIVDSITDPPGSERWATERLARIDPCFLCFQPIDGAPELEMPPLIRKGSVTFGSFNLPKKISPGTLAMWGRLLEATPGSTLVLKHAALSREWMREQLRDRLHAAGIDARRVTVLPPAPAYGDHLGAYRAMDVALDTFPYHGTTTTCEALWMGVPVITLRGDRHASRVGCSLLSAVGLPELIAGDAPEFVEIGRRLAADRERLAAWRTEGPGSLRARMAASPLCDGVAFAGRFQGAIRGAWRAWCAGRGGRAIAAASP